MLSEVIYFFNVNPKIIDSMTIREYSLMFDKIKTLEKEHYYLASKTNPELIDPDNNHIETSQIKSTDDIINKITDYKQKLEPIKKLR